MNINLLNKTKKNRQSCLDKYNNKHLNQINDNHQLKDDYRENTQSHDKEWDPDKELKNHKKDDPYIY